MVHPTIILIVVDKEKTWNIYSLEESEERSEWRQKIFILAFYGILKTEMQS